VKKQENSGPDSVHAPGSDPGAQESGSFDSDGARHVVAARAPAAVWSHVLRRRVDHLVDRAHERDARGLDAILADQRFAGHLGRCGVPRTDFRPGGSSKPDWTRWPG
jgi:hypothetical protein